MHWPDRFPPVERYMIVIFAGSADRAISSLHVVPTEDEWQRAFTDFRVRISRFRTAQ
jgi:hypothetical protein